MTVLQIVFLLIAAVTLASSILVVSSPRLVHAALWLVLSLAGVAAVFVLLNANFLAVVQVVIYIGAIAILVIFAVMLTRRVMADSGPQLTRTWWLAALVSLILFGALLALFLQTPSLLSATPGTIGAPDTLLSDLGRSLVDVDRYMIPFEIASVLLLAAMIGAIIIARPPTPGSDAEAEE